MSVDPARYSEAYVAAWKRFAECNWNVTTLTAADVSALSEDPHTKSWMTQLRTAPGARPAPASGPRKERVLAGKMASAIKAGLAGGPFDLSPLLAEAGERATMLSATMSVVTKALMHKIARLEQRCEQLEARPTVKHAGSWSGVTAYAEGHLVTHKGGLWSAKRASIGQRPGVDHDAWLLVVKSGQAVE